MLPTLTKANPEGTWGMPHSTLLHICIHMQKINPHLTNILLSPMLLLNRLSFKHPCSRNNLFSFPGYCLSSFQSSAGCRSSLEVEIFLLFLMAFRWHCRNHYFLRQHCCCDFWQQHEGRKYKPSWESKDEQQLGRWQVVRNIRDMGGPYTQCQFDTLVNCCLMDLISSYLWILLNQGNPPALLQ